MTSGHSETSQRDLDRLFGEGTVAGMGDAQLLERFVERRDEVAFAGLVARHGPMVLGVCRGILKDRDDADDAFQAVFLILVRKARSLRVEKSLASWLYRVSFRVAVEACSAGRRRRQREREVAQMKAREAVEAPGLDLGPILFEEVDRLPEKYRAPVVLCDFEGLTHEAAARSLGCPVGTVSGRLSRARELLRRRLTRRGVVLPAALSAAVIPPTVSAAVPAALAATTVEAAMKAAANGAISSVVLRLVDATIRSMLMTRLKLASAPLAATGLILIGLGALAQQRPAQGPARDPGKPAAPPKSSTSTSTSSAAPFAILRDADQIVRAAEDSPRDVVYTLITIAKAQAALGDRPAARSTLEHAARVADRLEPGERAVALCAMAYAHSLAGDREAMPGLLRDALKDAERIEDDDWKIRVLNEVGTAHAWAGDIASARECVRGLRAIVEATPDANEKLERSQPLVDLQAQVGDFDDALKVAGSSASPAYLSEMIANAVTSRTYHQGQPQRDLTPAQKEVAKGILRRILKAHRVPPAQVVIALAGLGEVDEALRIARALGPAGDAEGSVSLPCILAWIAASQARSGRQDAARKILREAREIADRHPDVEPCLSQVAETQAETGDVDGALRTAESIELQERTFALGVIADIQTGRGDRAGAQRTLRRALEAVRSALAPPAEPDPYWMEELATIQARLGDYPAALETARRTPEDRRAETLGSVAYYQVCAGKAAEALAWARRLDPPADRARVLGRLAAGLIPETTTATAPSGR